MAQVNLKEQMIPNSELPIKIHPFAFFLMKKMATSSPAAIKSIVTRINDTRAKHLSDIIDEGDFHFEVTLQHSDGDCKGSYAIGAWTLSDYAVKARNLPSTLIATHKKFLKDGYFPLSRIVDLPGFDGEITDLEERGVYTLFKYQIENSQTANWDDLIKELRSLAE